MSDSELPGPSKKKNRKRKKADNGNNNDVKVPKSGDNYFDELQPRGRVKLAILNRFFQAWMPIMLQAGYNSVYVDGFAGKGKYVKDNADGSPLVVYRAAYTHSNYQTFRSNLKMYFIEKDPKKSEQLKAHLAKLKAELEKDYPGRTRVTYEVLCGDFSEQMEMILDKMEPTDALFLFVDPFTYSGLVVPMTLMQSIMERVNHNAPTDIFINLHNGLANRWFTDDKKAHHIHKLLGIDDWSARLLPPNIVLTPEEKLEIFVEIYFEQLTKNIKPKIKPKHLPFGMKSTQNRHIYTLLFVTKSDKGIKEMKKSMWNQTQNEEMFQFSEFIEKKERPNMNKWDKDQRIKYFTEVITSILEEKFRGKGKVSGLLMQDYIEKNTIYEFNVKNPLKMKSKNPQEPSFADKYRVNYKTGQNAFEKMYFKID